MQNQVSYLLKITSYLSTTISIQSHSNMLYQLYFSQKLDRDIDLYQVFRLYLHCQSIHLNVAEKSKKELI